MLSEQQLSKILDEVHPEYILEHKSAHFLIWLFARFEKRLDLENLKEQIPQILFGDLTKTFVSYASKKDLKVHRLEDLLFDYLVAEILELSGNRSRDRESDSVSVADIFQAITEDKELFSTFKADLVPETVFGVKPKEKSFLSKAIVFRELKSKDIQFTPEGLNFLFRVLKNFTLAGKKLMRKGKLQNIIESLPGDASGRPLVQLEFKFVSLLFSEMKEKSLELHFEGPDCPLVSLLIHHADKFEPFYYPETVD